MFELVINNRSHFADGFVEGGYRGNWHDDFIDIFKLAGVVIAK